jgi:hypothetical protein
MQIVHDKNKEIRRGNIGLLSSILQADPSYAKSTDFKIIIGEAKVDKIKDISKAAERLLSK